MKGKVYLVGAGPGDPDLLTLKAFKILQTADVILHDDLISPEILALAPSTAFLQDVGKRCGRKSVAQSEINSRLVNLALSGLSVVRLKGGDPFIFGRGGEEIEALREGGIEFEIVPGVTAALGAAAAAHIPLTQRNVSSTLIILTGHSSNETTKEAGTKETRTKETKKDNWSGFVSSDATLVIYMPGHNYETTARRLLDAGMSADTPCALISRATSPDQQVYRTTVLELGSAPALSAPTLLIVGEVTRPTDHTSLHQEVGVRSELSENELSQQEIFALTQHPQAVSPVWDTQRDQEQSA